jgi:ABC-2 type transport system ATP-binding protein
MADLRLEERADAEIGTLSHGYRQRVGLLAALLGDPRLLLFDEPGNGLDPTSVGILRSLVRGLRREGRTVLVSSHNLLELERMCDEILILHEGKLIGRSSREELATRPGIWVVQLSAGSARANSLRKKFDGVRLADDEAAFLEEMNARRYASHVELSGGSVEALERRPYDLECLYHELVQDQANEASVE